ncbi:Large cysteine-rich periplasmic protein OmcB precursor [Pirellula sp. SH-Sr6A]|nr:Large cysteine-rich periplasmic protein OmcB precursor [Pirellula sp. SH-Sr6A]
MLASPAPGVRHLDGAQNPSMEIQKRAPAEVQVGLPATFTLLVRNVGSATAFDVAVHDAVPRGAKLVRTNPTAQVDGNGKLLWKLGEIAAGAEQVLTVELVPEAEGELGSVASVTFAAQASVRTMSTLPKLAVKQTAAESVLGGETVRVQIEVTNTGTGTARGVELEEDVPANMRHASGVSTLGMTLGDLAPGESERVEIELTAVSAGQAVNKVRAISTNQAVCESSATIDVVLPKLAVQLEGPRLRYLERQASYRATISNTGTAMANNVGLTVYLPRGMEFISAANEGTYMPDQHAVEWSLAELAAGAMASTEVALLPVQEGDFVLRMQGSADGVNSDPIDKKVQVEGQSELAFSIEDDNDPIETDGYTTYLIRVSNTGTRMDSEVQLVLELPEGSRSEQVHAPVNHQASQKAIVFAPIPAMQPKDQQVYRVSIRHTREGTHVVRAQLKSKNRPVPVIKEESTQVYSDN